MHAFFEDDDLQFAVENVLGSVFHRAADVGEVLTTVDRIPHGHPEAWVSEWTATADRVAGQARTAEAAGHPRSAAARWLRAASYYSEASDRAEAADDATGLWERHRAAWDRFADLTDTTVERLQIPYEDTTLPGYFFRSGPPDAARRTLVYTNGSDGSVVGAWTRGIADALARGWNAMTYDGPGQNAALMRQGLPFRPDWENVLTPVIDHLAPRPDVDPARIAVMGVSQGGYWVPRAAAHEHRIAAAVADPGVVDVSTTMLRQLPHVLIRLLESGHREEFDREMAWALKLSPSTRRMLQWRMRPYGVRSPFDFFTAARSYAVTDDQLAAITCPMLVTDPEDEQFWPGQSARLAAALTCPVTLLPFTATEGADSHCEPAAAGLRGERIFDWLDEHVAA
ncbi:prolyl oligopeptidase family serine peptidase [Geodermatophilus sabuli]|uniref:Prolyl oligopeptidase family serine peptidase n=1 Tax=Geodermatophilus sabuli TaxID=1564158 RepID=A0A7K3VWR7_9ACTN|nr:prolyl oligopeptidase family serine peptidase [Geodermatophilus sabuli]NEK56513.1 prolyl oligopeptidase family serine peptidase [Geodermatophilus sabuli]